MRGSVKARSSLSAKISSVSHCLPFLQNVEKALSVLLEDEAQKWSVSGAVMREEAMSVKACLKTL
jgi:hypothetical protein